MYKIAGILMFVLASLILVNETWAVNENLTVERLLKKAKPVFIVNEESTPVPVKIVSDEPTPTPEPTATPTPSTDEIQKWEYFYQCHPNPTNENEIRGFLNDRGQEGWEVVAAAGPGNLICEYYKRPATNN